MDKKTNKPAKERLQDEGTAHKWTQRKRRCALWVMLGKNETKQRGENSEKRKHEDKCAQARLFLANKQAHGAKHTKRLPPFSRKEKVVVSKQLDFNVLLFEQGDLRTKKVVSKQLDFNVLLFEQGDLEQGALRTKEEVNKQLDFNVLLTKSVSNLVFYAQSTSVVISGRC